MLKIAKNGLILHQVGSFGFSQIFFLQVPPPQSDFVPVEDRRGPKILSPPHQKFSLYWYCKTLCDCMQTCMNPQVSVGWQLGFQIGQESKCPNLQDLLNSYNLGLPKIFTCIYHTFYIISGVPLLYKGLKRLMFQIPGAYLT